MRSFDIVCIGAGLSAFGALAALTDRQVRASVLLLDGGALAHPALRGSSLSAPDQRVGWSAQHFGLPAVRAFGDGGTSRLWHGGLFVPHADDEVASALGTSSRSGGEGRAGAGRGFDLAEGLGELSRSPALSARTLSNALRKVQALRDEQAGAQPWRTVLIPVVPPFLAAGEFSDFGALTLTQDPGAVIDMSRSGQGWRLRIVREGGFEVVFARQILLCAGCLSSLALLCRLVQQPSHGYADHLHVFVGALHKPHLSPDLRQHLSVTRDAAHQYSLRRIWKTTVTDTLGRLVDVSLSFRSVANPDFPRAGRRFGAFVGSRASSRMAKVALGLKNPLTAIEMLGYKYGHEFPFEHVLIHATIAPRFPIGQVGPGVLTFEPDRVQLGLCGLKALEQFRDQFSIETSLDTRALRVFSIDDIASSLISGAQFCAGQSLDVPLAQYLSTCGDSLMVCDTAGMAFTSVYNQGLLSLVRGYALASRLKF